MPQRIIGKILGISRIPAFQLPTVLPGIDHRTAPSRSTHLQVDVHQAFALFYFRKRKAIFRHHAPRGRKTVACAYQRNGVIFSEEIQVSSISIVRIQIFQDLPGFFRLFLRQIFIKVRAEIINTVRRIISAHHFLRGFYMLRVHLADFSKLSGVGDPLSHVGIRLSQLSVIVPVFKGICLGFVYKSNQMLFLILSALIREDLVHDSRQH